MTEDLVSHFADWKVVPRFFSWNETRFYYELRAYAIKNKLLLLSKVRIADLVEVKPDVDEESKNMVLWKITNKHVDYVLIDTQGHVRCIIELNGDSHESKKMKESDELKRTFFATLKIPFETFLNGRKHDLSVLDNAILK